MCQLAAEVKAGSAVRAAAFSTAALTAEAERRDAKHAFSVALSAQRFARKALWKETVLYLPDAS